MDAKSCLSIILDPYKAGFEIGEQLKALQPEVIILFSSIHYHGSTELTEAIYETIDSEDLIIIGNTGDGVYEAGGVENIGVSALGINSHGTIRWNIHYKTGIGSNAYEVVKNCFLELREMTVSTPRFYFLASDFRADASMIVDAVSKYANAPAVGGLASDDYSMKQAFVYINKQVYTDTIAVLSAEGDFYFDISISHNMHEVGSVGEITDCEGTNVISIDNIPAMDFIERELGKPIETVDEGIITFKVTESETANQYQVRSLFLSENKFDKSVHLYGSVNAGMYAKTCLADPQKIITDVHGISKSINQLPFVPSASIIISCAGRKRVLQSKIAEEIRSVTSHNPGLKAIVGYPSLGEIGPIQNSGTYSTTYFHNMSFIILTIGDTSK
jgi:hypothetical protein